LLFGSFQLGFCERTISEFLSLGLESFLEGNYPQALEYFKGAQELNPNDPVVQQAIERTQRKQNEEKEFQKERERTLIQIGKEYAQNKDWVKAIDIFKTILNDNPHSEKAQYHLQAVKKELEDLIQNEEAPTTRKAYWEGALAYWNEAWSKAISHWEDVLIFEPTNRRATFFISHARQKLRNQAIGERIKFHYRKGRDFYDLQQFEVAIQSWQEVLNLNPDHAGAKGWIEKAKNEQTLYEKEKGKEKIQKLVEAGIDLYTQERYSKSMQKWKAILVLDPAHKTAQTYLKKCQAAIRTATSRRATSKPVHSSPSKRGHYTKGLEYLKSGDYSEAITQFEMALKRDPSHVEAAKALQKTRRSQNELAEKHYKEGLILYSQGNFSGAIKQWQIVLKTDPDHSKARRALIKVQIESGSE